MRRLISCASVLLLVVAAAPAAAQQREEASIQPLGTADASIPEQQRAFGEWIQSAATAVTLPAPKFADLSLRAQAVMESNASPASLAAMDAGIVAARKSVNDSTALLKALDPPHITAFALPAELQPGALNTSLLELNRRRLELLTGMDALSAAVRRRDVAAAVAANTRLLSISKLQLETLALISEARGAATPEDSTDRAFAQIVATLYRSEARLMALVGPSGAVRPDPKLQQDFGKMADAVDGAIARGEEAAQAMINRVDALRAPAAEKGDASRVAALDRVIRGHQVIAANFERARALSAQLRIEGKALGTSVPALPRVFTSIRTLSVLEQELGREAIRAIAIIANAPAS